MTTFKNEKFKGVSTALVTPFKGNKVDFKSFSQLLDFQIECGISNFVVAGTTGESPTLQPEEVRDLYQETRNKLGTRGIVIIGTGSNSTQKTVIDSQNAEKMGADAILVVVPYYNKPPQRGLYQHFKTVADSVSIPTILYNVPSRTVTSLSLDTITKLSEIKNIIGIKEASGSIEFASSILKSCPEGFLLLGGDDASYVDILEVGGHGVISVASHIIPKQMINWTKWCSTGFVSKAKENLAEFKDLIDILFSEANPIPIKKALEQMGIINTAELRLPLVECEEKLAAGLRKLMVEKRII